MHTQRSSLDEGVYLVKGLLFATGQYLPYQPYGPYMHKLPLAFLIPGVVQAIEPGIRSGRLFAFVLNLLLLLALFLTARRLAAGPAWQRTLWGGGVTWVMALNTGLLKIYTQAISEGLIACLLAWTLFFVLGPDRKPWQIAAGSFLAGVIVMTRENLLPLVPLVILYAAWTHGLRT
ncbi:MAG TPA: hypothetical protein VFF68_04960, partial [Anaerolineaceae bacterium]|nr:hypothetical protein [Anaerolineaceae bacterium]